MDTLGNLGFGLATALQWSNILACFIGAVLGTLIGVLPGLGPTATISLLLPLTFAMPREASLIMLAGIYYGAQYGGSTTAILVNLPGEASSAITAIEGYKMAQKGQAGPALAAAAIGSFFAGTIATVIIALFAPLLIGISLQLAPADYFSLMVLGLVCAVALAHGSVLKALAMVVIGLILGVVGTDVNTGTQRFTFGFLQLADGVDIVAVGLGLFGIAEILKNLGERGGEGEPTIAPIGRLMPTLADLKRIVAPAIRGTALGSLLGIIPGGSAALASFAAYGLEKKVSRNAKNFGHGAIEGVVAPESANNAAGQTSFIPMLSLGLPSNAVMALMIGAMIIQGVVPGPSVMTREPALFWGIIASMWVGNLMLVILNLPLVGIWVRLLRIPYKVLFPAILVFSCIGVYSLNYKPSDLYVLFACGAVGYILILLECEPAPILLGMVLGPMMEENLRRAMIVSFGDPLVFVQRPISLSILLLAVVLLILALLPSLKRKRAEVFVED